MTEKKIRQAGFYLSLNSKENETLKRPKLLMEKTIIELFKETYPGFFDHLVATFGPVDDMRNYRNFSFKAKALYLYEAIKSEEEIETLLGLYREKQFAKIVNSTYTQAQAMTTKECFEAAINDLQQKYSKPKLPRIFVDYLQFIQSSSFRPFDGRLQQAFELSIHQQHVAGKLKPWLQEAMGEQVQHVLETKTSSVDFNDVNFHVPDYLILTQDAWVPMDAKLELLLANGSSLAKENTDLLIDYINRQPLEQ